MSGFSMISVVKLCNAGCQVKMTDISCQVILRGKIVVTCSKCTQTGLWMMPLATLTKSDTCAEKETTFNEADLAVAHNAHSVTSTATQAELAVYHHQSLFCPTETTLLKAVNNNQLDPFPGLTKALLKHLPPSTATYKGHMHRTRQGIQSTRKTPMTPKQHGPSWRT